MNARYVAIPLLAAGLLASGCSGKSEAARKSASEALPTRTVKVAPVELGTVIQSVELIGELQGIEEVRVFAQVPDRIRKLAIEEGDVVKAGDLLATISSDLQAEAVNQAEAGLEAALANRDATKDNLARMRTLREGSSIAQSQLDGVEAQYRASEAQVRQMTAMVAQASAQQSRTLVRAPIAGVVTQVMLREGDLAAPSVPIATIVRSDKLKAVLRVPERDFLHVETGMPVRISPLAKPDQAVEAKVSLKGPVVDRLTRTGLVEVNLDNKAGQLVAGSAVRAQIELGRKPNVVMVPAEAVIFTIETDRNGKALAFVAEGERARRVDVTVGARQGSALEIASGLQPGQSLIVQGAHFLRDGNPIALETEDAKAQPKTTEKKAEGAAEKAQ
jgi:RND family efflux transporter MFP subunit